jgi:crotonobetainyl-CoA:carnitine CoA-transferase CaiB-like acyl-CoA transferase
MTLPLENIRVLDLSRLLPGPYCSWLLADMGADVIRVEQPGEIAKQDAVFGHQGMDQKFRKKIRAHEYLSRNKRSLLLNLKEEQSRSIVYKLAERSDVFIEDYRPGIMKKMGLDQQWVS